jgi:hypothetical protein
MAQQTAVEFLIEGIEARNMLLLKHIYQNLKVKILNNTTLKPTALGYKKKPTENDNNYRNIRD